MDNNFTTIDDVVNTSLSGRMIEVVHAALDTYPVLIYNGEEEPSEHKLGKALTSISFELRKVKEKTTENTDLLAGMKRRREIKADLSNTATKFAKYLGLHKKWRGILRIIQLIIWGFTLYIGIRLIFYHDNLTSVIQIQPTQQKNTITTNNGGSSIKQTEHK